MENIGQSQSVVTLLTGLAFIAGFLVSVITIWNKRSKFGYILHVLRIAKAAFWPNCYVFFFSIIFTVISISAFIANISLLGIYLTREGNIISPAIPTTFVLIEAIWTHGFLQGLSDFFFESIAIHWYYKRQRRQQKKSICCDTLLLTLKLIYRHIGTIIFGHVIAYIPEILNTLVSRLQLYNPCCYHTCCLLHEGIIKYLTKYCYF
jgi:hypothetical protein